MIDKKVIKSTILGIALMFLLFGQFLLLNGAGLIAGIIFIVLSVILFAVALTGAHSMIIAYFQKLIADSRKKAEIKKEMSAVPKGVKSRKIVSSKAADSEPQALMPLKSSVFRVISVAFAGFVQNGLTVVIPKWVFFLLAGIIFAAAQPMMVSGNYTNVFLLFFVSISVTVFALFIKGTAVRFTLRISNGVRFLVVVGGLFLVFFGWYLLIQQPIPTQMTGVLFTVLGCVLAFLALPMGDDVTHPEYKDNPMLFDKPEWMKGYIFKGICILVFFILMQIGNKFLNNPNLSMISIAIYLTACVFIYFAFPIFNVRESDEPNKVVDIIRLAAVIAAVFLAYLGQVEFTKHVIPKAVNYFLIAGFIFVTVAPMRRRPEEELVPFSVRYEMLFMLLLLAVGIFLRTYEIELRPFGIENDEAGGAVTRFARSGDVIPSTVGLYGIPYHLVSVFVAFMGGQIGRLPLKLMSVAIGIVSIPAIYFMLRRMIGVRSAMFGSAIYVLLRWAIHYGRFGQTTIWTIMAEMFAFYFLFTAVTTRKKTHWFLAGLTLTMAWHSVTTAFLLVFPVAIYFIIKAMGDRNYLKSNAVGLMAFFLGTWIFGSMILHNYFLSNRIYFARAQEVSVFSKDPNAPSKNVGLGIVENAKTVMLMFNHLGDSRSRNSGGAPNEPTIDFTSAIFYGLGLMFAAYYSKHFMMFIMFLAFFSQSLGSILTIEAPSAMRAVGTMVPMVFFIALVFERIWLLVKRVFGLKREMLYFIPVLVAVLIPVARDNWKSYFTTWTGGMDELSTAAGMYAKELGEKTRVVLYTGLYYPGHPPFKIYRWDNKANSGNRLTTIMMWLKMVENDDFAIFFHYDTWQNIQSVASTFFPESKIVEVEQSHFNKKLKPGEGFGMFVKSVVLKNDYIKKIRGLTGNYSFGAEIKNDLPVFRPADIAKVPYTASWKGTILIPYYGKFRIYNSARTPVTVSVDGKNASLGMGLILSEGFHNFKIEARRESTADAVNLTMEGRGMEGGVVRGVEMIKLDEKYLYNWKNYGLHSYYFAGTKWDSSPELFEINNMEIDVNSYQGGDSQILKGYINIPVSGKYVITAASNIYSRVIIDKKYYWEQLSTQVSNDNAVEYFKSKPAMTKVAAFDLSKGRHAIDIYTGSNGFDLKWMPPGSKEQQPVPVSLFEPDNYVTPELALLN